MKVTISKTVTRTYNFWSYENYKPSITITKEYSENEEIDITQEIKKITDELDYQLKLEKQKITPKDNEPKK